MRSCGSTKPKRCSQDGIYYVESIVAERLIKNQKFYKVRWEGFAAEEESWEPEENLANVRNLIYKFHQRKKSRNEFHIPSSSTSSMKANFPQTTTTTSSSNGGRSRSQTEFMKAQKRRIGKSRSGRFEYVPKNELVALKTKYFDDIRDGKIDLTTSDLYSRVKTRRRCIADSSGHSVNDEDSLSRPASLAELTSDTDAVTPARYSEPSSPKHLTQSTDGSIDGTISADSAPSQTDTRTHHRTDPREVSGGVPLPPTMDDSTTGRLPSLKGRRKKVPRLGSLKLTFSSFSKRRTQFSRRHRSKRTRFLPTFRPAPPSTNEQLSAEPMKIEEPTPVKEFEPEEDANGRRLETEESELIETRDAKRETVEQIDCSPPQFEKYSPRQDSTPISGVTVEETQHMEGVKEELPPLELPAPQQTVPLVTDLLSYYFNLYHQDRKEAKVEEGENMTAVPKEPFSAETSTNPDLPWSNASNSSDSRLAAFPCLKPIVEGFSIETPAELVAAIKHQQWTLLATQSSSSLTNLIAEARKIQPNNGEAVMAPPMEPKMSIQSPLVAAIIGGEGRGYLVQRLLDCGGDPNFVDPLSGWPLLVIAAYFGRIQAAQVLLEANAHPNAAVTVNGRWMTALAVAITAGDVDMASLLILYGANFYNVEENTTAMKLIMTILRAITSGCEESSPTKPASSSYGSSVSSFGTTITVYGTRPSEDVADRFTISRLQRRVSNGFVLPPPRPPKDLLLPRSPYDHLVHSVNTPAHQLCPLAPQSAFETTRQQSATNRLPSATALSRIYEVIACHHARLSLAVDTLLRCWLVSVGLVQDRVIMPCQWITVQQKEFSVDFYTPTLPPVEVAEESVPILLLIHGTVAPPGCYHVWMQDDGPCLVQDVLLGPFEQKPLGRQKFVTTLFPLARGPAKQTVTVRLLPPENHQSHRVCIAATVISVKRRSHWVLPSGHTPGNRHDRRAKPGEGLRCCVCLHTRNNDLDLPPSLPETIRAVQQISSGKALGSDAIPPEVYKHGGPRLMAEFTTHFQEMWRQGQVPQDFKDATIVHLYKRKGNLQLCDNHRGISLLKIAGKIFARILINRLNEHIE
ncbi:unnamed protein product [Schistocephalus solidus]|uniref:Chromo domain-containing protein n=1 Tax=Schistocephalus solidus TaxID=70667 RepID=A0A183SW44_SCHSO|nr:unnamed protein product [Schistocephalus solidus]